VRHLIQRGKMFLKKLSLGWLTFPKIPQIDSKQTDRQKMKGRLFYHAVARFEEAPRMSSASLMVLGSARRLYLTR
jgi:hypothetical protein